MNSSFVELHVDDFDVVKNYYSLFGFSVEREDEVGGTHGYLVMVLEDNYISFWPGTSDVYGHSYFSQFDQDAPRGVGVEIVFLVHDVDALYEKVKGAVDVLEEPRLRPWGQRDFRVSDPNGYYLRFTQHHDVSQTHPGG